MNRTIAAATASFLLAMPAPAHEGMSMPGMEMSKPAPETAETSSEPVKVEPQVDGDHDGHSGHDDHATLMEGLFGGYAMNRDASGTAWQPDAAPHDATHVMKGDWTLMGHLVLNGVYDWQGGPRGDEKAFVNGMIMGAARRDFNNGGVLNFRGMLAPDPFMGKSGYPLLFQAGETADGQTLLRDRQHPHDLFMELSGSYAHPFTENDSVFIYAGLPGEPSFGPPAFMHRITAMDSPEAPLSHHWFDSTHVTFGVVTLGWVHMNWKIEASSFRGREPDEELRHRIATSGFGICAVVVEPDRAHCPANILGRSVFARSLTPGRRRNTLVRFGDVHAAIVRRRNIIRHSRLQPQGSRR